MPTATSPTKLIDLVRDVRVNLLELQPRFWSDDELFKHLINGAKLLWKRLLDLHQNHFLTIDATNVTLAANSSTLSGVPADTFRITLIEPRVLTSSSASRLIRFVPRKYNSAEFVEARSLDPQDTGSSLVIYYDIVQEGAPVNTPTVQIAPQVNAVINLRFCYLRTFPVVTTDLNNPIPGESDVALIAYATAFALGKRPDGSVTGPDPAWLSIFKAEEDALLTALTPRQEQDVEVAEDIFGSWGN